MNATTTVLVLGATGATGRLLVTQLLDRGLRVKAIVRSLEGLPEALGRHERLSLYEASLLDLSDEQLAQHTKGCDAVGCCLGHNLTLKGVFGPPRRLVTDATRRVCRAVEANRSGAATKYVLMNTVGNRDRGEAVSLPHASVTFALRWLVPPHADNEQAAAFLRSSYGQNDSMIDWAVVRPDSLIDRDQVTDYTVHPAPTRSAIFNPGKTSRINVAHFMADLICDPKIWQQWRRRMPVIYNSESTHDAES